MFHRTGLASRSLPAAVWTEDGEGFFLAESTGGGALTFSVSKGCQRVPLIDLRRYLPPDPASKLLLKIDIEGAENEVMPAVLPLLSRKVILFIETHGGTQAWIDLCGRLASFGFNPEIVREHDIYVNGFAVRL
jgi:hypothetical protein